MSSSSSAPPTQPPRRRRSVADLLSSPALQQETEPQGNRFKKECFPMNALYIGNKAVKNGVVKHRVIPFGLDTLPLMNPVTVDGVDVPVYEHVSKDRLAIKLSVARMGQGVGKPALFLRKEEFITEHELLYIT